jgi:hypothetical protein
LTLTFLFFDEMSKFFFYRILDTLRIFLIPNML